MLLPGASRLARLVGSVRKAANQRLWDTLYGLLTVLLGATHRRGSLRSAGTPGADLGLDDDGDFDRPDGGCEAGDLQQALGKRLPLALVQALPRDSQDGEIAGRAQAPEHGGAVEVRAEELRRQDAADESDGLLKLIHYLTVESRRRRRRARRGRCIGLACDQGLFMCGF